MGAKHSHLPKHPEQHSHQSTTGMHGWQLLASSPDSIFHPATRQLVPASQASSHITAVVKSTAACGKGKQMLESYICSRSRAGRVQIRQQMQYGSGCSKPFETCKQRRCFPGTSTLPSIYSQCDRSGSQHQDGLQEAKGMTDALVQMPH